MVAIRLGRICWIQGTAYGCCKKLARDRAWQNHDIGYVLEPGSTPIDVLVMSCSEFQTRIFSPSSSNTDQNET